MLEEGRRGRWGVLISANGTVNGEKKAIGRLKTYLIGEKADLGCRWLASVVLSYLGQARRRPGDGRGDACGRRLRRRSINFKRWIGIYNLVRLVRPNRVDSRVLIESIQSRAGHNSDIRELRPLLLCSTPLWIFDLCFIYSSCGLKK